MQTQISVFQFQSAQNVRVEIKNGEPWFCLKDVADILDIQVASPERFNLKESGIAKISLQTGGGKQQLTFINEPNLYRVIFRSNKPEAVKFQDWIFEEVIPQIRQTGGYVLHLDRWLNEWECAQIRAAVKERCIRTGETSQAVYRKLHAFMGIPSYEQIGATQFQTALNFLASMENAPDLFRQPEAPKLRNLQGALIHGLYCAEFIYHHYEALHLLNRKLAAGIIDHAKDGAACLRDVAEQSGLNLPNGQYFQYFPWDGDYDAKHRYNALFA